MQIVQVHALYLPRYAPCLPFGIPMTVPAHALVTHSRRRRLDEKPQKQFDYLHQDLEFILTWLKNALRSVWLLPIQFHPYVLHPPCSSASVSPPLCSQDSGVWLLQLPPFHFQTPSSTEQRILTGSMREVLGGAGL
jgi:hypothetical protein